MDNGGTGDPVRNPGNPDLSSGDMKTQESVGIKAILATHRAAMSWPGALVVHVGGR